MQKILASLGLALVLAVTLLPATIDAIHCWQCNSAADKMCKEVPAGPIANISTLSECFKKYYVDCPQTDGNQAAFCRKQVQSFHGSDTRVIRACGYQKDELDNYKVKSPAVLSMNSQCYTDGCNSAMGVVSSIFMVMASLFAVQLFARQ